MRSLSCVFKILRRLDCFRRPVCIWPSDPYLNESVVRSKLLYIRTCFYADELCSLVRCCFCLPGKIITSFNLVRKRNTTRSSSGSRSRTTCCVIDLSSSACLVYWSEVELSMFERTGFPSMLTSMIPWTFLWFWILSIRWTMSRLASLGVIMVRALRGECAAWIGFEYLVINSNYQYQHKLNLLILGRRLFVLCTRHI